MTVTAAELLLSLPDASTTYSVAEYVPRDVKVYDPAASELPMTMVLVNAVHVSLSVDVLKVEFEASRVTELDTRLIVMLF